MHSMSIGIQPYRKQQRGRDVYTKTLQKNVESARDQGVTVFEGKQGWHNAFILYSLASDGPTSALQLAKVSDIDQSVINRRLRDLASEKCVLLVRKEMSEKKVEKHVYSLTPLGAWVAAFLPVNEMWETGPPLGSPPQGNPFQTFLFPKLIEETFGALPAKIRYQLCYLMYSKLWEYFDSPVARQSFSELQKKVEINKYPVLNIDLYYQGMGCWERDGVGTPELNRKESSE